jgi:hypothetical protein
MSIVSAVGAVSPRTGKFRLDEGWLKALMLSLRLRGRLGVDVARFGFVGVSVGV